MVYRLLLQLELRGFLVVVHFMGLGFMILELCLHSVVARCFRESMPFFWVEWSKPQQAGAFLKRKARQWAAETPLSCLMSRVAERRLRHCALGGAGELMDSVGLDVSWVVCDRPTTNATSYAFCTTQHASRVWRSWFR